MICSRCRIISSFLMGCGSSSIFSVFFAIRFTNSFKEMTTCGCVLFFLMTTMGVYPFEFVMDC